MLMVFNDGGEHARSISHLKIEILYSRQQERGNVFSSGRRAGGVMLHTTAHQLAVILTTAATSTSTCSTCCE